MKNTRLVIVYKNFAAWQGISHIGLGVSAQMNAEYLGRHGVRAEVLAVKNNVDLVNFLKENTDVTDVVISALWLSVLDIETMCRYFKGVRFVSVSHSNVGFLQADPGAFTLLRRYIALSRDLKNLSIGANCHKFGDWLAVAYDTPVVVLENLYTIWEGTKDKQPKDLVRIGTLGAIRPQKNVLSAAAAALYIHQKLKVPVEFSLSTGREDGGGNVILRAVREMCGNLADFFLVERFWSDWRSFRRVIREQDLLVQVSYTESFNMVTADGIAEGVPSVVSPAITWVPDDWKVEPDDVVEIAERGIRALKNLKDEARRGFDALVKHNEQGLKEWLAYLKG